MAPPPRDAVADEGVRPPEFHLGRIALGFYLDLIDMGREGGDVLSPLLMAAVREANLAPIGAAAGEALRPVSINALAGSLGLPYETVRRRVHLMAADGRCEIGPAGVVAPDADRWTASDQARAAPLQARVRRMWTDITERAGRADIAEDAPEPPAAPPEPEAALRLCDRLVTQYFLRVAEVVVGELGDPFTGFVVLNLARANIRQAPLADEAGREDLPRDRQAARALRLAETLGVPAETIRRHVRALEERGYIVARPEGLVLSDEALRSSVAHKLIPAAAMNAVRLLGQLRRAGVLELWEVEARARVSG